MLSRHTTKARVFSLLFVLVVLVAVFPVDAQITPIPLPKPIPVSPQPLPRPGPIPSRPAAAASPTGWLAFEGANAEIAGSGSKWTTGNNQPLVDAAVRICDTTLPAQNVDTRNLRVNGAPLVPIGGDYWHMTHKSRASFGHQGSCWFRAVQGVKDMRSPAFPLQAYIAVRARGEGKIEARGEDDSVIGTVNVQPLAPQPTPTMTELTIDTRAASGKRGRLVAVPAAGKSIDFDDVRVYTGVPKNPSFAKDIGVGGRAWGFADLHVHLATHQAMGGLDNIRTMWGVPGTSFKEYAQNPKLINRDIPRCNGFNHRVPENTGPEGFLGAGLINGMSGRVPDPEFSGAFIHGMFHHDQGGPGFQRKQHYKDGFHQQHHITAIRRAYEGGLRLMGVLANHSEFLELLQGRVRKENGREFIQLTKEIDLARAHVCYVQQLADLNSDWMEIAYSADDAQRIISSNKLALIIGLELPDAGNLVRGATPEQEVNELYALGIRQITIIHGADNKLGASQVFQDVYDWYTDLMWTGRDDQDRVFRGIDEIKVTPSRNMNTREGGCGTPGSTIASPVKGQRGECVLYTLGKLPLRPVLTRVNSILNKEGAPLIMSAIFPTAAGAFLNPVTAPITAPLFPLVAPFVAMVPVLYTTLTAIPEFNTPTGLVAPKSLPGVGLAAMGSAAATSAERAIRDGSGHLNAAGLTPRGEDYVKAMMSRGMMIDLAHASDLSTQRVFELSREVRDPSCRVSIVNKVGEVKRIAEDKSAANSACFANAYPLIVSHSQIRAQSIQQMVDVGTDEKKKAVLALKARGGIGVATANKNWAPREFEISNSQLAWFERIGGVVGIFMGQDGIVDPPPNQRGPVLPNNCANSTNAFALAYAYANQMLNGHGAALSSDATYHDMSGPRFGPQACMTDLYPPSHIENQLNPQFFRSSAQANAVRYTTTSAASAQAKQGQAPLTPYKQDTITWDYNVDGWANYGVVPDMLQDAKNLGLDDESMSAMFRSAQDYVDAWAKATRVSRCDEAGGKCIDAEVKRQMTCSGPGGLCKGTCPLDTNAGAPAEVPNLLPPCGGDGQRACCFGETGYPCRLGLQEVPGCKGPACQCGGGSIAMASSTCRPTSPCGGIGERACCAGEADFGTCKAGGEAVPGCTMGDAKCKCGKGSILLSAHHCEPKATECGGVGQRACCSLETGYVCKPGARVVDGCPYGPQACRCGKGSAALAMHRCEAPLADTPCGGPNQRACCAGETGYDCKPGEAIVKGGCPYGEAACRCGKGSTVQAITHCEAPPPPPPPAPGAGCGEKGQRACCMGETGYTCRTGVITAGCPYGEAACKCGKGSIFPASHHCK